MNMSVPSFRRFDPDAYLQTLGGEAAKAAKVAKVDPAPAAEGETLAGLATLAGAPAWDAADWREYFEERAAVGEYDHGLTRPEAEARALEWCVARWLADHPPPANEPENRCAHCVKPLADADALPFLNGAGGHVWMHARCHAPWMKRRRAEAEAALAALGVKP